MSKTEFKSFRAENAGCIQEAEMPLEDQGLVCIQGQNLDEGDSNGSGKTTLFELLAHTLFGKTSKETRKNDLLNAIEPKNYHTSVRFKRDVLYTVDQYRKHSEKGTSIEIRLGDSPNNIAPDGYDNAQSAAQKYSGFLWREFLGSVYLSQKHTHTMIEGKPSEKQAYLSRYFGLDSIDAMITESSRRISAVPLPNETHIKEMLGHVKEELDALGDIGPIKEELLRKKEDQKKVQKELVVLRVEENKLEKAREVEEVRNKWIKRLSKIGLKLSAGPIKKEIESLRNKLSSTKRAIDDQELFLDLTRKLEELGVNTDLTYDEVQEELSSILSAEEDLSPLISRVKERSLLEREISSLPPGASEDDPEALSSKKESHLSKRDTASKKLAVYEQQVSNLKSIGSEVCPTCQRQIDGSEISDLLSVREEKISTIQDRLVKIGKSIRSLTKRIEEAREYRELNSKINDLPSGDVDSLEEKMDSLLKEKKRLKALSSTLVKAASLQARLQDLTPSTVSADKLSSRFSKIKDRIDKLESAHRFALQHADSEYDPSALQRTRGSILYKESFLEEVSEDLLSLSDKVTRWNSFQEQKVSLESALEGSSKEKNRHQALTYVNFTLKELKKLGLRESTELLTQVLPVYLKQLFPQGDVSLRVTDKADGFDLLFQKGGQSIPLKSISGGQSKRVGIAIIFAFAKMGKRTSNLLIADEPFTHLDKKGRHACYELLRDLDIGTILVTAHDQDLQSSRKYDRIWTVKMKNHRSRLYLD
tara:strand:- start:2934 stop:5219 length:2286 start_codon:yes stop_codon:yes gene_type:complete